MAEARLMIRKVAPIRAAVLRIMAARFKSVPVALQTIVAFALAALPLSRMAAVNGPPVVKNAQDHTTIEDADASAIPISHLCTSNS
jgi:hypothetical protein